jgi:Ycf66 protein N-terminus
MINFSFNLASLSGLALVLIAISLPITAFLERPRVMDNVIKNFVLGWLHLAMDRGLNNLSIFRRSHRRPEKHFRADAGTSVETDSADFPRLARKCFSGRLCEHEKIDPTFTSYLILIPIGLLLIFYGWRFDPIMQISQILLVGLDAYWISKDQNWL